ncbi:MAG: leucyl aminopeptidase, partial [Jatrophihabitans sp.]
MPSPVSVVAPSSPVRADVVIVGVRNTPDGPRLVSGAEAIDKALKGRLLEALRVLGATGRADEVLKVPTLLADFPLVIGTGFGTDATDGEAVRRAAGAAVRALADQRRVHFAVDASAGALAEGALLGQYAFTTYRSTPPKARPRTYTIAAPASARAEVKRAVIVAQAVNTARDLVNTPPNDLYPETLASRAKILAEEHGLSVEILDEKALKKHKFGGIIGVGQGSVRPPRLVRVSYRPTKPKAHLALVGKGITFDSGGINLKTANLTWMKSDMGGAAAVITSIAAIAALKIPISVTATVPMAENMPSGTSYRPSDILTMYNGTTVEVGDTDAEGRLILADAISRAAEDNPDRLIEASTLTGAQLVSL